MGWRAQQQWDADERARLRALASRERRAWPLLFWLSLLALTGAVAGLIIKAFLGN